MNWGYVPVGNIAAMSITCILCFVLPIALLIIFSRKKGWVPAFFIGCGIFIAFALILEQMLHTVVLGSIGTVLRGNIFLYGLYGGLAAALFEETGRWIAFRFLLRKHMNTGTALMYGAGHGGIEAMLLVGLTYINNIVTSIMINTGMIDQTLAALDESTKQAVYEQLSPLWTSSADAFLMGGVERVLAILLHIALSLLVYLAVKNKKKSPLALTFSFHFLVDFFTVILANYVGLTAVELMLAVMVGGILGITGKIYKEIETVKD